MRSNAKEPNCPSALQDPQLRHVSTSNDSQWSVDMGCRDEPSDRAPLMPFEQDYLSEQPKPPATGKWTSRLCSSTRQWLQPFRWILILVSILAVVYLLLLGLVNLVPTRRIFRDNPLPDRPISFNNQSLDPLTAKYILLDTLFAQFEVYGIEAFLVDGVLLGYYRWGGLQPWDHDFEIRFLDVENALKYWKHRVAIRMVLGYADRKQPSLGDSTWPQVEYPYCSPSSDDTGGTYQCDGLQGKKVVLSIQTEPLFVDLNDVCGVNINGCGFNERGFQKFTETCHIANTDTLACGPLQPAVLRGKGPMQEARVKVPYDLQGFLAKYGSSLWKCRPDGEQCQTHSGCGVDWLILMFVALQGEIDCMVVDRAYGGIAHVDAQPGYRAYYPDGTRYPQFKGFKGLSELWPSKSNTSDPAEVR